MQNLFTLTVHSFLLSIVFFAGCRDIYEPKEYDLEERVTISYGEEVILPDERLSLTFLEVLSDSRCPSSPLIDCIWAGNAEIKLEVNQFKITLNSFSEPRNRSIQEYTFTLDSVEPHPVTGEAGEIEEDDYEITLIVTRH